MITAPSLCLSGETGETYTAMKVPREGVKVSLLWLSSAGAMSGTRPDKRKKGASQVITPAHCGNPPGLKESVFEAAQSWR